jgi:hypothetical protein|tara:strand:+ start:114 stop:638 length:525 start_codon:yes stop_codon:yes gene_type:complete
MEISNLHFNKAVPGEAITNTPGQYPFNQAPLLVSPVESMEHVLNSYLSGNNAEEVLKLIIAGVTLEMLANVIVKSYFMEGTFTVDVAEIIKPAIVLHLLADARDAGVKNIRIMNDSNVSELSPEDFVSIKNELRGDEMEEEEMPEIPEMPEMTEMSEMSEMPDSVGSFLDMENI